MSRCCIVTGWHGSEFAAIAAETIPLIASYAVQHGHEFVVTDLGGERPPSWMKIRALLAALESHELAVWIDADVVIADSRHDIVAAMPADSWQAMVAHDTPCGTVPNCGVWVLGKPMVPVLERAWNETEFVSHPWWEQAAILRLMGYAIEPGPKARLDVPTTLFERTAFLPQEWNHHPYDRGKTESPHFIHVTQYLSRLSTVQSIVSEIKEGNQKAARHE